MTFIISSLLIFVFTIVLTIAGLGTAFIVIPTLYWLGFPLAEAMAVALLLNAISLSIASVNYIRFKLVDFKLALMILMPAVMLAPIGSWSVKFLPKNIVVIFFSIFLLFAASMMLFYKPKPSKEQKDYSKPTPKITLLGVVAGYLGGLLGVGGGNFILPVLVWLGYNTKIASATTSFIVVFISLSGFFGHAGFGNINYSLLAFSVIASVSGAFIGSWLMNYKLNSGQVKKVIAIVLYAIAVKMLWGVL